MIADAYTHATERVQTRAGGLCGPSAKIDVGRNRKEIRTIVKRRNHVAVKNKLSSVFSTEHTMENGVSLAERLAVGNRSTKFLFNLAHFFFLSLGVVVR